METVYYDLEGERRDSGVNLRWIQPPQISYLVTTMDEYGNTNVTPVTMGTSFGPPWYYVFCLSNLAIPDWDGEAFKPGVKQGYWNLKQRPECVISYYGYDLLRKSWIAAMPLPRGISEMDVAELTPLPSRKVAPPGIAECPVNIEARVITSQRVGSRWTLYTCELVGVSVDAEMVRKDREVNKGLGVLAIDPLFEVKIGKDPANPTSGVRLYYNRMDTSRIERCPEDLGCNDEWIGSFEQWLKDEEGRGKLTAQERAEVLALNGHWLENPDPRTNGGVQRELTARLRDLVRQR